MKNLSAPDWIALTLVIVGALNWGLIGLFGFDLVAAIFGEMSVMSRLVYLIVGVSAVFLAIVAGGFGKKQTA